LKDWLNLLKNSSTKANKGHGVEFSERLYIRACEIVAIGDNGF
jgi:hypothetical protein